MYVSAFARPRSMYPEAVVFLLLLIVDFAISSLVATLIYLVVTIALLKNYLLILRKVYNLRVHHSSTGTYLFAQFKDKIRKAIAINPYLCVIRPVPSDALQLPPHSLTDIVHVPEKIVELLLHLQRTQIYQIRLLP